MKDYFTFIDRGYDLFLVAGNDSLLKKAASVTEGNYGRPNAMQDYLYLRVTQKEPFNILYFTPAITTIMNLDDGSFQISPELLYTGFYQLGVPAERDGSGWTERDRLRRKTKRLQG